MNSLLGNLKVVGAEGGTSVAFHASLVIPASQQNPTIRVLRLSGQPRLGVYFVDAKRTRRSVLLAA